MQCQHVFRCDRPVMGLPCWPRFFLGGVGKGPIYIDNNYPKIITYKNYQSWASHVGSLRYTHRLTEIVSVALLLVGCLLGGRIRLMRLQSAMGMSSLTSGFTI